MKFLLRVIFVASVLWCCTCSRQNAIAQSPPAPQPNLVLVAKVTGRATMIIGGTETALTIDQMIPTGAKLRTPEAGSLILAISDGTSLRLEADGELIVDSPGDAQTRP